MDNCCFNRPYDDQTQPRILFESTSKLYIQELISNKVIDFVWSFILEYENEMNPFAERKNTIIEFKRYATSTVLSNAEIVKKAIDIKKTGIKTKDALHLACALSANCEYFLTVDDKVLKYSCSGMQITDPVDFTNKIVKGGFET